MNLELQTERLLLTPLDHADGEFEVKLWTDPEVIKFICDMPTEDEVREEMPDAVKRGGNGGIGIWCIKNRKTGEKLGSTYILPMPVDEDDVDFSLVVTGQMPDADIAIGYFLNPAAWGHGYATEVCKSLLRFAFENLPLDEIVASVDDNNVASRSVLEKSGLIDRGRARSYGKDDPIYRITRDEWNESRRAE
jgi:ribosomal-protein-alanine N-acetyltransferase